MSPLLMRPCRGDACESEPPVAELRAASQECLSAYSWHLRSCAHIIYDVLQAVPHSAWQDVKIHIAPSRTVLLDPPDDALQVEEQTLRLR